MPAKKPTTRKATAKKPVAKSTSKKPVNPANEPANMKEKKIKGGFLGLQTLGSIKRDSKLVNADGTFKLGAVAQKMKAAGAPSTKIIDMQNKLRDANLKMKNLKK